MNALRTGALRVALAAVILSCRPEKAEAAFAAAAAPPPAATPERATGPLPSLAPLVKEVKNAVVSIYTTENVRPRRRFRGHPLPGPFGGGEEEDPFEQWRRFFGDIPEGGMQRQGLGSGFVIDPKGLILTNNHVVERADEIKVSTTGGKEYSAKVKGRDPATDVALIEIDAAGLSALTLGDSDKLEVGDYVVAIGNPFNLPGTVSAGIVSAKERHTPGGSQFQEFIQTDAAINPGNSGGPLLNLRGEVVGINTAILGQGGNIGIGFAVPINTVKDLLPQLREKGKVSRGYLGVLIQDITPELAEQFKVPGGKGALVSQVFTGSPADKAGIRPGDVVVEFNGKSIDSYNQLSRLAAATQPGDKARVKILRDGKEKALEMKVAERGDESMTAMSEEKGAEGQMGLVVKNLTPEAARELGVSANEGVVVDEVESGGAASKAGVQRGDVIVELDRKSVSSVEDFKQALAGIKAGSVTSMRVRRGGGAIYLSIKLPKK